MELNNFIENFADQFDETEVSVFKPETIFKDLDEWSSLHALSIIAMVDDQYGVRIKGEDIRSTTTISSLFDLIKEKKMQA